MKIVTSNEHVDLKNEITWRNIHSFKNGESSPCTALALYENDIATVGEDGCINLLTAQSQIVVRKIGRTIFTFKESLLLIYFSFTDDADSCSIHRVIFIKHNEILTSNLRGQMKIWDLRSNNKVPNITFMLSGDQVTPTCLAYHPTQRHLIIAGDDLGNYLNVSSSEKQIQILILF